MREVLLKRLDVILLSVILLVSFLSWFFVTKTQFIGEGFQYFGEWTLIKKAVPLVRHDTFAIIFFKTAPAILGAKVESYMWVLFITMLLYDLVFYLVTRAMIGWKGATVATALFAISFAGKYDMFADGGYQYFVQRAVPLLPLLITTFFLNFFIKKNKLIFLLFSLLSFITSFLTGFFSGWFTPFVFFWAAVSGILERRLRLIIAAFLFLIIHYFFTSMSGYVPQDSMIAYVLQNPDHLWGIPQQLAVISFPPGTYNFLVGKLRSEFIVALVTFGTYFFALRVIKAKKGNFELALSSFLAAVASLFLNLYINEAAVLGTTDSSRYYYFPIAFVAIFWAIFLSSLMDLRRRTILISVILSLVVFFNYKAILRAYSERKWEHEVNKEALSKVVDWSTQLKKEPSVVYLPTTLGPYGVWFAYRFYSNPGGQFYEERIHPLDYKELMKNKVDPKRLYVLHFDPERQVIVDKTQESRNTLESLYISGNVQKKLSN